MIGRPWVHLRAVDSTNRHARALAERGAPHGTLVTADEQTAGRGRQGRRWVAPAGRAVLASVLVRELDDRHATLPLAAAVAVCEAAEALTGARTGIKWPNDVWLEGRKVAGILLEGRPQAGWAVIGIGLNVNTRAHEFPADLRETATSLAQAPGGGPLDRRAVLDALLAALGRRLAAAPADVLAAWRERDALRGRSVRWSEGEGTAEGVTDAGALIVATAVGRRYLEAGEVHLQR